MARVEYVSKSLGWRMLLLLFWTVFVCAVLYASKGSQMSDISKDYFKRFSSRRPKRVTHNSSRRQYECKAVSPKQEDLDMLGSFFYSRRREKPTVHCAVASPCDGDTSFQADCFSRGCRVYRVRVKRGNHVLSSLSSEALSRLVESRLQENSFMTVEDLNWYIDIQCKDPTDSYMKIAGDILQRPHCQNKVVPETTNERETVQETTLNKINILYFRFLSEWELPVRFPGLFSLINKHAKGRNVTVMDFKNYQATRWGEDETLALLLQGRAGPFSYNNSLLHGLHQDGHCFRLEDFSCSRSRQQEILVSNVTSSSRLACDVPSWPQRDKLMEKMCTEGNLTDAEIREVLMSLLSHAHDVDSMNGDPRLLLTMSILNTKDFRNSEVLDYALMNLFTILLGQKNRAVLLMSGVGNPIFLRFDQNVRLQSQASNPVLMLMSTGDMAIMDSYSEVIQLQRSSFSMFQLHHFLRVLTGNGSGVLNSKADLFESYDRDDSDLCRMLKVKPPFMCLCEGQFVNYENDSLMAGFAEFAVSIINSQLRHLKQGISDKSRSHCAKLSGLSFTNVRVGFHENKKRILMDIYLEIELYKDKVLRGISLDIWDTDKIPQAEVQLFKADTSSRLPPSNVQTDRFLKTLCQTGERLDHHTSSETGLMKRWSQERHFGRSGRVTHVHDNCLYLFVRDFGDSISVEMANVCRDRRYDVMVHLSLMNMMSLSRLPLSASLGHVEREVLAVVIKVSYTVPTFAYKLHPDFDVTYDD